MISKLSKMNSLKKCDIIRAGAEAMISGQCTNSPLPPDCYVTDLATKQDMYFRAKYNPSSFISETSYEIQKKQLNILQGDINYDINQLKSKYGSSVETDITWNDFTNCLWNPNGSKGGPHNNKYFERNDLTSLGYQPRPLFGGNILEGKLPPKVTNFVPVWLDHIFNPDLAIVVILLFLVVIFVGLIYSFYKWEKEAPERKAKKKAALRAKLEKNDPYRYTKFPSYPKDLNSKWKYYIHTYTYTLKFNTIYIKNEYI